MFQLPDRMRGSFPPTKSIQIASDQRTESEIWMEATHTAKRSGVIATAVFEANAPISIQ
jgi:hypothetical protein